ncbi:MAG: hypothetical protein FJ010_12675 [Chloroflexi bacterium]|nr:hypothetical protein [Chloroflexota bacterium]
MTSDFDPGKFVDRPVTLQELKKWLDTPQEKRVKSVLGAPGSGKTWVLKKLESELNNRCFLLWLNVLEWINRGNEQDPINSTFAHECLEETWKRAERFCDIPDLIDHTADLIVIIEKLVEIVCDCGFECDPIVIVDGYDEITEKQAKAFSKRVLEPFVSRPCVRMILAYRDDWTLEGDALRRNESKPPFRVGTVDEDFAVSQFRLLFPGSPPTNEKLIAWMKQKRYQWNVPLINRILFQKGFNRNSPGLQPLTNQDFHDCFKEAIERPDSQGNPRYEMLNPDQFEMIYQMANQLPDQWSSTTVEELFGMPNFYMDNRVKRFFDLGLIEHEDNIHQIVSGLRELLREITD